MDDARGLIGEIGRLHHARPRSGSPAGDDVLGVPLVLVAPRLAFGLVAVATRAAVGRLTAQSRSYRNTDDNDGDGGHVSSGSEPEL